MPRQDPQHTETGEAADKIREANAEDTMPMSREQLLEALSPEPIDNRSDTERRLRQED
ncbi:hypothetical protein NDR87_36390 [Nocardia sp. CDC159]|uniref:DUF3072 domain-containing protein n=1 Tax=Nocardia pulmonis TaxID=2951408 RepID=A0A9X2EHW2_9NOCA|nr:MULTISPECIES: hypothetical protein [Nocardia]MCM6778968.1 hypothetical protein [Nocardia pulmonis]MCM6791857.1 hypothetical protein [Nocardia sp. CDC159]